ncbi:flagellar motor switch protein FliG [Tersicoccus sp. MR15.9]|uniref:flagellar motor switch protein FliG n=1 Tax=Tersicoccus mangrovi TaxID=3121635 RepID=UPI002FE5E371
MNQPAALPRPLNGTQKAAVVLMQMSAENAARVLAQFSEAEAEEIAGEIVRLNRVDSETAESVIAEFHDLALSGRRTPLGGRGVAADLLEASFGAERAAGVMDRVTSTAAGRSFEFLEDIEAGDLVNLLDGELPETAALVLAHLDPQQASAVLAGLDRSRSVEIARAIAVMGTATPEAIGVVAETLRARVGTSGVPRRAATVGGLQPLLNIINRADVATERAVLDGLDERDPVLAEEVRARMLTFEDLVTFERRDVQRILRGLDPALLARAMKGAPAPVVEVVLCNVSDRNREILQAEMASTGPVRASEVEQARAEVVRSIRALEADGEITLRRGEDDFVD